MRVQIDHVLLSSNIYTGGQQISEIKLHILNILLD